MIPVPESMAPNPMRQKRLHNFTLPPLKWMSPMVRRCSNDAGAVTDASAGGDRLSPASCSNDETVSSRRTESRSILKTPNSIDGVKDGIEEVRQKLVLDLKNAANKLKNAIFVNEVAEEEELQQQKRELPPGVTAVTASVAVEGVTHWNLRKRRADGKALVTSRDSGKGSKINEMKHNDSSPATNGGSVMKPSLRSESEKTQKVKFTVELSRKEIEEDYMMMLGHRPLRRPNKRPKSFQKDLDTVFPGLWLREVTPDLYKVSETRNAKARKGKGLKGLIQSCDSD